MKEMKLVLGNGMEFPGKAYGAAVPAAGEIVFNTSMVGYQEVISDPAYSGKIVVMTYPLMGQYGITAEDYEARNTAPAGLVVRECCETPSNFRFTKTLSEELEEHGVPCLSGLDTRMLTRIIRDSGQMKAAIVDSGTPTAEALGLIESSSSDGSGLVAGVSCGKRWFSRTPNHRFDVVALDCGIKHSVVTELNRLGCNVTVVPFNFSAEEILAFNPNGVLVSGGPGSPEDVSELTELVNALKGRLPVAGISLGHQLIAMSYGARISRLECPHHGGRPVRRLSDGRIFTACHNHDYTVDAASLSRTALEVSFVDVCDGSVEGLSCPSDRVISVQFYPEGAPGPKESDFFDNFIQMMEI